ncbi:polysaccharide deacetylase family protein [Chlamydia ibidis]|uniref:Polysaccharide deacetylase family protein n=2 Tax=Chlamydia ibidis TaxID=1405396 RepID=S7KJE3_9CHLA|nr:polysaccharide deacetylase family protein [Chlamydia ibidis]EPP34550.1 polysaccharide deacetylase family protein [Chlamydia ibidis]EQM62966.1 polysaccharide deacetylase family protein [Chlamydia ibidis 10-1398/6]
MLIVLAFRRLFFSKPPGFLNNLLRYFLLLKQQYPIVFPGDPIQGTALMLTFDFASVDFYTHVFPFLERHKIPAIVGVASRYVSQDAAQDLPLEFRCVPMETLAFQDEVFTKYQPFCSREELITLSHSPYIRLASSGFAIRNLHQSPPYLTTEVFLSKHYIENQIGVSPIAFFYPFGKHDTSSDNLVQKHYPYSFVLGNTLNFKNKRHNIYRLDMKSDNLILPQITRNSLSYIKFWLNDRLKQFHLKHQALE